MPQTAAEAGFTSSKQPGYLEWFLANQDVTRISITGPMETADKLIDQVQRPGFVRAGPYDEQILGIVENVPAAPAPLRVIGPSTIVSAPYSEPVSISPQSITVIGTGAAVLQIIYLGKLIAETIVAVGESTEAMVRMFRCDSRKFKARIRTLKGAGRDTRVGIRGPDGKVAESEEERQSKEEESEWWEFWDWFS